MQLTTLGGNKAAMFMLIFANFKSCVLSRTPLGDCMMPRGDVPARVQTSHGNK